MAITVVQNLAPGDAGVSQGASASYTPPSAFTVGNTIIIVFCTFSESGLATSVTVGGNSATRDRSTTFGDAHLEIWRCSNLASAGNVVVNWSGSIGFGNFILRGILEVSGLLNSGVLDVTPTITSGNSTGPSISSGTLAQADELIVAAFQNRGSADPTITHPGTYTGIMANGNWSTDASGAAAYKIVSSTSSDTATWSLNTATGWEAALVSYRAAAGGTIDRGDDNTVSCTDALATEANYTRSASDSVSVADSVEASVGQLFDRDASDSVSLTDQVVAATHYLRTGSDSVSVSDAVEASVGQSYERGDDNTISVSDAIDLELGISFSSDTIEISDTTAAHITLGRSASDTISVTDSAATGVTFGRLPSDSIDVTEQLVASSSYVRTGSDAAVVTDQASIEVGRSPSDTISVSDALATQAQYVREGADSIVITDETDVTIGAVVTVEASDSISIAESVQTATSYVRAGSDAIDTTDACAPACAYARAGNDALVVSDEVERDLFVPESGTIDVAVSDSIGLTDVLANEASYIRAGFDSVTTTDLAARSLEALREASDTATTTDTLSVGSAFGRILDDSVGTSDTLITWADYRRLASDAVAISDEVSASLVTPNLEVEIDDPPLGVADAVLALKWITITTAADRTLYVKKEDRTVEVT